MLEYFQRLYSRYVNPHWARVISLIFTGVILIIIYEFNVQDIHVSIGLNQQPARGFIEKILLPSCQVFGTAILAGGFLAFFLKSFQFIGLFRDEISKVVFGQEFLTRTTTEYKEEVWKNITTSLCQSSFSDINDKISNIIYDKYIPKGLEFYHEGMTVIYEFEKVDENHIAIIEKQTFKIKSKADTINFSSQSYFWKENNERDLSDVQFIQFSIDDTNVACKPYLNTKSIVVDGLRKFYIDVNVELKGKEEYSVIKYVKTIHSNKLNVYWKNEISRYTKSFELIIKQNPNFERI
jgi:hypothetical protein